MALILMILDHRPLPRILAWRQPVDMRKSFDGLVGVVRSHLDEDPLSGSLFVFFNRRRDRTKILFWDRSGLCLRRMPSADTTGSTRAGTFLKLRAGPMPAGSSSTPRVRTRRRRIESWS